MSNNIVTLDVREDIKRGREPFSRIMQAVAGLKGHEDLRLIAPFEPAPLFGVLAQQGFSHETTPTAGGDYEVLFTRSLEKSSAPEKTPGRPQSSSATNHATCTGTPVLVVDARGLEPPQPMVKILEAVATLPQGAQLRALTDRRPMHLYAQLEQRGFIGESEEQKDGSFVTHVRPR